MNRDFKLIRVTRSSVNATVGVLLIDREPRFVTLEDPDKNNARNVSCIPEGFYECKRVVNRQTLSGKTIPLTLEVLDVPGRHGILFHSGNTQQDTQGCILLGMGLGTGSVRTITSSILAMQRFREELRFEQSSYALEILWA